MAVSGMPEHLWTYRARVQRVIDGDTVVLTVDLGFGIAKSSADNHFRILGVNCPEKRGATRDAGLVAWAFTEQWLAHPWGELQPHAGGWPLIIQTERIMDSEVRTFERWVAAVWRVDDGANLAVDLIANGHGVASKAVEPAITREAAEPAITNEPTPGVPVKRLHMGRTNPLRTGP